MFPIATTLNELNSDNPAEPQGPIGSLVVGMQTPGPQSPPMPEAPAAGPASAMAEAAGAAQQAALTQEHLAAQQQAAEHLAALKGAAHGSGLRVQVVGAQPPQW